MSPTKCISIFSAHALKNMFSPASPSFCFLNCSSVCIYHPGLVLDRNDGVGYTVQLVNDNVRLVGLDPIVERLVVVVPAV